MNKTPFPVGNRFWELRSKHGRDMLFSSPTLLWEACKEYFEWCEDNPLVEVDFRGKDAIEVKLPKMRAFTITGLCLYLDCNVQYFNDLERALKLKDTEEAADYSAVVTRVRAIIYTQKFTGAAAGFLNPNIIARDLGLVDKSDVVTAGESINTTNAPVIIQLPDGTQFKT